jgi:hypothetical protein
MVDRNINKSWGICVYQNGMMTARPSISSHLPISSPPKDMCVETWYQGVLLTDERQSIEEGSSKPEEFKAPFKFYLGSREKQEWRKEEAEKLSEK